MLACTHLYCNIPARFHIHFTPHCQKLLSPYINESYNESSVLTLPLRVPIAVAWITSTPCLSNPLHVTLYTTKHQIIIMIMRVRLAAFIVIFYAGCSRSCPAASKLYLFHVKCGVKQVVKTTCRFISI